jgi:hypothetical protein
MQNKIFETKEDALKRINERKNKVERIALSTLEQCKGEGLTIYEFNTVVDTLKHLVERNTRL